MRGISQIHGALSPLSFNNPDFVYRQPVQLIHQRVNLLVGRGDLALDGFQLVRRLGFGEVLVSFSIVSTSSPCLASVVCDLSY